MEKNTTINNLLNTSGGVKYFTQEAGKIYPVGKFYPVIIAPSAMEVEERKQNEQELLVSTHDKIQVVCDSVAFFLRKKNARYGNSALEPIRVFSKSDSEDQLLNRIDDKLSRIKNSEELRKNDVVDLMGYLVLICIKKGWMDFKDLLD